jgi:hypothetical protein
MQIYKDWLFKSLLVIISLLAPIKPIIITVFVLISADFLTGMWAAVKRGEKISSAEMRRTVSKFLVYSVAVVIGFLVEKYLLGDVFPVSKLISGTIGIVELKSLLENCNTILGRDMFEQVILKLGSKNDPSNKP